MFSKNAVVTMINGQLFLVFRIGNIRKSQLIESHVRAQIVHARTSTDEGQTFYFAQEEIKVATGFGDEDDRSLMILPSGIYHRIDSDSPFYDKEPKEILESKFEMVVCFEGIVEPTGNSVQARTSYLPREILWGYRFENMVRGSLLLHCRNVLIINAPFPGELLQQARHLRRRLLLPQRRRPRRHSQAFHEADRVQQEEDLQEGQRAPGHEELLLREVLSQDPGAHGRRDGNGDDGEHARVKQRRIVRHLYITLYIYTREYTHILSIFL